MRSRSVQMALALSLMISALAFAEERAEITLTAAADEIATGDPVFLKTLVTNKGDEPLLVYRSMGSSYGGAHIEVRAPEATEFRHVRMKFEGLRNDRPIPPYAQVAPNESYAGYSMIFLDGAKLAFGVPGRYEVRVVVTLASEEHALRRITSEPITLKVEEREDEEAELINESIEELWDALPTPEGMNESIKSPSLSTLQKTLDKSILSETLEWNCLILEVFKAAEPATRVGALDRLEKIRAEANPVISEIIGLILAEKYIERREWKDALAVLDTLDTRSYQSDNIHRVAEHALGKSATQSVR